MIASVTVTSSGFKRLERTARYPNFKTIIRIVKLLKKKRVRHLNIYSRGPGFYKRMFTNILKANFIVLKCINTTKYAHNGCKLRKQVRK
jgi:ribosomal protein S11